ncbi:MAG TPA: RNA polymerase sigma-70 factor [Sphingobacterium sp.]|nr:RNA polymerase sigma-70 factor [Sphingobacterium sp.]
MGKYSTYSDLELVAKLRKGDQYAYTEIYNRFKVPLYTFLWKRLNDKEIVRDILHDLFLAIWEKRDSINYETSLSGYLFSSVRNKLLDQIAHEKVQQKYIDSFHSFINMTDVSTDHLVRSKELSARIAQEIAGLPPKTREVFELSRVSNLSRKEIAEQLGVSEQTVKSHMFNALKTLKLKLGSFLILLFL